MLSILQVEQDDLAHEPNIAIEFACYFGRENLAISEHISVKPRAQECLTNKYSNQNSNRPFDKCEPRIPAL